jgi:hypothetical protein
MSQPSDKGSRKLLNCIGDIHLLLTEPGLACLPRRAKEDRARGNVESPTLCASIGHNQPLKASLGKVVEVTSDLLAYALWLLTEPRAQKT